MKVAHLLGTALALVLVGCGGDSSDSTPTPPPSGGAQTLSSIRVPTPTVALNAGQFATLAPEALDAGGRVITGATGYTYSIAAAAVAESQGSGVILGIGAGATTVTVSLTRDGVTATSTVTVTVTGTLPSTATVTAGDASRVFTPATIVVARNANVSFAFGALLHNVTFRGQAGAPAAVPNTTNATLARVFGTVGDYDYDCSLHAGMTGKVVVR
jgi:plastocyanin